MNWLLLAAVVTLVLLFGSSSSLASAYGIAVFGTMVVTTLLACVVMSRSWGWGPVKTGLMMVPLLLIDLTFLSSNLVKLLDGGYVPLLIAGAFFVLMWTWVKGTRILFEKTRKIDVPFLELVQMLEKSPPHRVKGTAVFLTSDPDTAPAALLHNLKHNKVLHEKNVILTVNSADIPRVDDEDRVVHRACRRFVLAHPPELRLHGDAQHPARARDPAQAGLQVRHHGDVVLPVAALDPSRQPVGHAALAGQAVHRPRQIGQRRHGLLPDPDRPRGGSRHAGHGVSLLPIGRRDVSFGHP